MKKHAIPASAFTTDAKGRITKIIPREIPESEYKKHGLDMLPSEAAKVFWAPMEALVKQLTKPDRERYKVLPMDPQCEHLRGEVEVPDGKDLAFAVESRLRGMCKVSLKQTHRLEVWASRYLNMPPKYVAYLEPAPAVVQQVHTDCGIQPMSWRVNTKRITFEKQWPVGVTRMFPGCVMADSEKAAHILYKVCDELEAKYKEQYPHRSLREVVGLFANKRRYPRVAIFAIDRFEMNSLSIALDEDTAFHIRIPTSFIDNFPACFE